MHPTAEECHKDQCRDTDQQFSRILWRWAAEPLGLFDEITSNHHRLQVSMEFMIGSLLRRSTDASLHEFWCDGVDFVESKVNDGKFYFGGSCIFSNRLCDVMWLAPFGLDLRFHGSVDFPDSVTLRLGHPSSSEDRISKRYPSNRQNRLYSLSHALYGMRPAADERWAAIVDLNPYRIV